MDLILTDDEDLNQNNVDVVWYFCMSCFLQLGKNANSCITLSVLFIISA